MKTNTKIQILLAGIASLFILPYAGALIKYGWHFPSKRFIYPATEPLAKAGFNTTIFIILGIMFVGLITFYLFPRLFGFKKVAPKPSTVVRNAKLPFWFYLGLVTWVICLIILWGENPHLAPLFKFCDMGLWWGLTFILDGIVYYRRGGTSLFSNSAQELIAISLASVSGWMIFEYINFYVNRNWYYPIAHSMPVAEFFCYSMLASTAVFPISFEFYSLFNTFPKFQVKYSAGWKIKVPKSVCWIIIILCMISLFFISFYPDDLFFAVWLAPLLMFINLLYVLDIWSPFNLLEKGDWSPLLLLALSWVVSGLCVECWNYFSGTHVDGILQTKNTLYWRYSVPYVNDYHLFEMPILGYMGYLPYGVYAAIWWLVFAYMQGIPTQFTAENHKDL
jgi:hypothetical protein